MARGIKRHRKKGGNSGTKGLVQAAKQRRYDALCGEVRVRTLTPDELRHYLDTRELPEEPRPPPDAPTTESFPTA